MAVDVPRTVSIKVQVLRDVAQNKRELSSLSDQIQEVQKEAATVERKSLGGIIRERNRAADAAKQHAAAAKGLTQTLAQTARSLDQVAASTKAVAQTDWSVAIESVRKQGFSVEQLAASLNEAEQASLHLFLQNKNLAKSNIEVGATQVDVQQAMRRSTVAYEQMGIQTTRLIGSTMRMVRGMALLGISGEEDLQKLLRGLVKIQAVFDILGGGMATVARMSRMYRTWERATLAVAAAHTVLATAQGATLAGGAMGTIPGSAAAAASAGVGVGVGVGGAALIAPAMGAAAALASVALAATTAAGTLRDIQKYGVGGGAAPGTLRETTANWMVRVIAWSRRKLGATEGLPEGHIPGRSGFGAAVTELIQTQIALEKAGATTETRKEMHELFLAGHQLKGQQQQRRQALFAQASQLGIGGPPLTRLQILTEQHRRSGQNLKSLRGQLETAGEFDKPGLGQRIEDRSQEQLQTAMAITEERKRQREIIKQTNAISLKGLQDQHKALQQQIDLVRNARMSQAERLARMNPIQQAQLKAAAAKMRRISGGSGERMSVEELSRLDPVRDSPELNRGALGEFWRIGGALQEEIYGKDTESTRREADLRAKQAATAGLMVGLQDTRNMRVTLIRDDTNLITAIKKQIVEQLEDRDDKMLKEILESLRERDVILFQRDESNTTNQGNRRAAAALN